MSKHDQLAKLYDNVALDSNRSIRVLDLQPSLLPTAIQVTLRTTNLSLKSSYETLSYTWGESNQGRTILANKSFRISVTDNLYNALWRLRKRRSPRTLWVDRVCINQSNVSERNAQVAMMGLIYRKSVFVNVWLGEPGFTPPVNLGAGIPADAIYWHIQEPWAQEGKSRWNSNLRNEARILENAIENTKPSWHGRAWVLQEFVLARKVYLWAGQYCWPFDMQWLMHLEQDANRLVHRDVVLLHNLTSLARNMIGNMDMLRLQNGTHRVLKSSTTAGLFEFMAHKPRAEATNPRDQVYCLLGMIGEEEAKLLDINYSLDCAEVFTLATYASVMIRKHLDILQLVVRGHRREGLPTWSPDFEHDKDTFGLTRRIEMFATGPSICFNEKATTIISMDDSRKLLTLPGVKIDSVLETLTCSPATAWQSWLSQFVGLILNAAKAIQHRQDLPSNCPASVLAVFQTLSAGTGVDPVEEFEQNTKGLIRGRDEQLEIGQFKQLVGLILHRGFSLWTNLTRLDGFTDRNERSLSETPERLKYYTRLESAIDQAIFYSSSTITVFTTANGLIGVGPSDIQRNDIVVHVDSMSNLVALQDSEGICTFNGHVFVHGLWGDHFSSALDMVGMEWSGLVLR